MKRHFSLLMIVAGLTVSILALVILFNVTSPVSAGSLGTLVVLALIYLVTFFTLLLVIRLFQMTLRVIRPRTETVVGKEKSRLAYKRLLLVTAALSFVPTFLISLNSIGQLSFTDVVLIIIIEAVAIFYIFRTVR